MEYSELTAICYDIVGSSRFESVEQAAIQTFIHRTIQNLSPPPSNGWHFGDSGVLLFFSNIDAYYALSSLLCSWSIQSRPVSPILTGIRIGVHFGPASDHEALGVDKSSPCVNTANRLAMMGQPDTVVLSEAAFNGFSPFLISNGINANELDTSSIKGFSQSLTLYQINFREFLRADQYLVRFDLPTDLLMHLASNPKALYTIPPRKFEEVIADLLADIGYQVELTKQTRDNGIDIIAIKREVCLGFLERYLIQCKRNAPKNRVGIAIVHEMLGVGAEEPHTGLVIATTSTFTAPAKALAQKENVRWQLHLKDYNDIQIWLSSYADRHSDK